jgi:hypothetical protein
VPEPPEWTPPPPEPPLFPFTGFPPPPPPPEEVIVLNTESDPFDPEFNVPELVFPLPPAPIVTEYVVPEVTAKLLPVL